MTTAGRRAWLVRAPLVGVLLIGALLLAVGGPSPPARAAPTAWRPPLPEPLLLVRPFDDPGRYAPGHRGVDLRVAPGSDVLAPADGVVRFAGPVATRPVVSVDVGPRRFSYEPVRPVVRDGQVVRAGQPLGIVVAGHPGCGACLHWGLRVDAGTPAERYLDPLRAARGPIRLLPLEGAPNATATSSGAPLVPALGLLVGGRVRTSGRAARLRSRPRRRRRRRGSSTTSRSLAAGPPASGASP